MRREPGSSRPQGEIRDVLASSSCVISQICEYEMTLPCGETQNRLKFKLDKSFQQRRERERREISAGCWLSLAGQLWLTRRTGDKKYSYQASPPPSLPPSPPADSLTNTRQISFIRGRFSQGAVSSDMLEPAPPPPPQT